MLSERVKEWNKQSMERGRKIGRTEGRTEGKQQGTRQLLLVMLIKKFSIAASDIEQRLTDASDEQITEWAERILTAESIGDVFGH